MTNPQYQQSNTYISQQNPSHYANTYEPIPQASTGQNEQPDYGAMANRGFNAARDGVKNLGQNEYLLSGKKICCNPGLKEFEKDIKSAPAGDMKNLIFRYSLSKLFFY